MSKGTSGGGAGGGGGSATVTGSDTFGPSKAKVTHKDYTRKEINQAVKKTLGKNATIQDVASAVGAPSEASVNISLTGNSELYVSVSGPGYQAERWINKGADGKTQIVNVSLDISQTGTGLGTRIFGRQVEQAQKLGVDRITAYAAGKKGDATYNGYYTWARLGYDAPIPSVVKGKLPKELSGSKNISDLMRSDGGAKFWKEHGIETWMTFDLKRGSVSQKALNKYLKKKGIKKDD